MDEGKKMGGLPGTSNSTRTTESSSEPRPLKDGVEADPGGPERLLTLQQQFYEHDRDIERVNMMLHKLNVMDLERPPPFRVQQLSTQSNVFGKLDHLEKLVLQGNSSDEINQSGSSLQLLQAVNPQNTFNILLLTRKPQPCLHLTKTRLLTKYSLLHP